MESLAIGDDSETVRFAENIDNIINIAKAHNITPKSWRPHGHSQNA